MAKKINARVLFDGKIKSTYQNYQRFMNADRLPQFDIVHQKTNTSSMYAEVKFGDKYKIEVNPDLLKASTETVREILYHEFTHIYDRYNIYDKTINEGAFHLYTEYHATQIQVLRALGVDNIESELCSNDILNTLLKRYEEMYLESLVNCFRTLDPIEYQHFKRVFCYYLGVKSIIADVEGINRNDIEIVCPAADLLPYLNKIKNILLQLSYKQKPQMRDFDDLHAAQEEFDNLFINLVIANQIKSSGF